MGGDGPEVVFLSNPLADPVRWSEPVRPRLQALGYRVTTFEHRCVGLDWRSAVACATEFVRSQPDPVAVVGWSQGGAVAQEVALALPEHVTCAALLATYGRQNEVDKTFQECWDLLAQGGDELAPLRLAMSLLTAFPPARLADDTFVARMRQTGSESAGRPDPARRRRSAQFIATYQDRLEALTRVRVPTLVMAFALDADTFARRAREVAEAIPDADFMELPGLGHAAPISDPDRVWPPVLEFLQRHHTDRTARGA
ncbi:alpha/beta fold hydrolase [Occultella aeris]|uniref:Non-heme bromoperoxidase BpoC n=1 Tax=Occultella aeris TaxID=2761496 RepID=A0A7M4DF94_9MICO|nr:alpha/beta hydrolase [Occultella aeris]VZO35587.1 Putative non-heme bromoperoxidase BpoC [Occultella aeris]